MNSILRLFIAPIVTLLAALNTGCAGTGTSTQPIYDDYIARFNAAQPHTERTIARADGLTLKAREFGTVHKDKGGAPTLVLMHGFPDNQHLYDLIIPPLAKNFHVVSFDFLGWGDSDKPNPFLYNVASQRADLDAVVSALKLDSVVIVVHDLSGHVGIDWALDNEAKTQALVLLNTYYTPMPTLVAPDAIEFYSTPGVLRDLAIWGANKSQSRFQSGLASQIGKFMSNAAERSVFVPVISHSAPGIRPAFFSSTGVLWDEINQRVKNLPRAAQFKKPVHIIFGVDDPFLNTGVATEFERMFSNASLDLIDNANHYVQLDQADQVSRIMLEKLRAK
jgi:haloalkane dehalogenase